MAITSKNIGRSSTVCGLMLCLLIAASARGQSPEAKGLSYLAREVPRWAKENKCYSCHNNADGARALMLGSERIDRNQALDDSLAWLSSPEKWEHNGGEGPFSDKRLARIQFAAALSDAVNSGRIKDRAVLRRVAEQLIKEQADDGSWAPDGPDAIGSPATLGRPLATWTTREILKSADPQKFATAIQKADAWLKKLQPQTMIDASVILLAGPDHPQKIKARERIRKGQGDIGGWGPYLDTPPEPFDTALVLLALVASKDTDRRAITRGRDALIQTQLDDGSWPETTRPAGNESYAQRVSTAGWAVRALLATDAYLKRK